MTAPAQSDLPGIARSLGPVIRGGAAEGDANRCLPTRVVHAMIEAGLFRMTVDSRFGGCDTDPLTTIRTIEAVSEADGGAGWTLMIGSEVAALASASIEDGPGHEIFDDPQVMLCGALNPQGRFEAVEGGFRVSGRWPYGSGCQHAGWFWGGGVVYRDGKPCELRPGTMDFREAAIPRSAYRIEDTWHVAGLRGSGSHDVVVEDAFVPARFVTRVLFDGFKPTGPLARFPVSSRLAYNKVGVATGIARAAVDAFAELAAGKTPFLSGQVLRERPQAQLAMAEAVATLRAGRAFCFEAVGELWEAAVSGAEIDIAKRSMVRLACSFAVESAVRAVEIVHRAAGATANSQSSPLERQFRDVHVVPQHTTVSAQWYQDAGRVLLGLEPSSRSF